MAGNRSLGTLTIDLVAKTGGFEQGLSKAERELDKRAKRMNDIAKKIGVGIGTAITAGIAGAVAAAGAISLITKQAIDNADAMRDMSIRLGTSTETLSAFAYAASQTGTDIDTLGRGLKVLAKNAADSLNPTSEQAKVFAALGVTVTDASGKLKDMSDLVPEIADKFKQLEDGTTKAALAQALFGKAGLDLTEFLNQGSQGLEEMTDKARALGIVIDGETAAAADDFNDQLGDLKALMAGLGLQVAKELLPRLNDLVESLSEVVKEGGAAKSIAEGIGTAFDVAGKAATVTAATFRGVAYDLTAITLAAVAAGKALSRDFLGAAAFLKQAADFRKMAAAESDKIEQAFGPDFSGVLDGRERWKNVISGATSSGDVDAAALAKALSNPTIATGGGRSKSGRSGAAKAAEDARRALEEQIKAVIGAQEEFASLAAQLDGPVAAANYRYAQDQERLNELARVGEISREDLAKAQANLTKQYQEDVEAINARLNPAQQVIENMQFELALLGMTNIEREKAIALRYADVDAMSAEGQKIGELTESIHQAAKANQVWDEAQRSLSDSMFDAITGASSLKDAFLDLVDNIERAILKSITDGWAQSITDWFKGAVSGSSSGGDGTSWGAIIGALLGGGKASGGGVQSWSMQPVNEYRPELLTVGGKDYLMMGAQAGHVTPKPNLGGGLVVNQTLISQTPFTQRSVMQLEQEAAFKLRQATARS